MVLCLCMLVLNGRIFIATDSASSLLFSDEILNTVEEENKQNKPTGKKKVKRGKENNVEVSKAVQSKIHGKMVWIY